MLFVGVREGVCALARLGNAREWIWQSDEGLARRILHGDVVYTPTMRWVWDMVWIVSYCAFRLWSREGLHPEQIPRWVNLRACQYSGLKQTQDRDDGCSGGIVFSSPR